MQKKLLYILILIIFFGVGYFVSKGSGSDLCEVKRAQIIMGTFVEIQVRDENEDKADAAISKAFNEIKRIDALFSSHNQNSLVWKINHDSDAPKSMPEELFSLLALSDSIWKISNGAFDVSLGTLNELWDLGSNIPSVPDKNEIMAVLDNSGWTNIHISRNSRINVKKNVKLDFGAVAKGYAVDRAIETLEQCRVNAALVNAGGEVKVFGYDWIVGIQHPRNKNKLIKTIKLNGMSVATSGDYEQYFEVNGKRYHHILNPKTGMPADSCQSVTIICKENKLADALATAVFVLGREKGLQLVEKLNEVEAMIIDSKGEVFSSKGFNDFVLR